MAKTTKILSFILLFFIISVFSSTPSNALGGKKLGGRTQIQDVKTNKEIQDLGKFCVEEYNRNLQKQKQKVNNNNGLLSFSEVVEAEKQVVSGIKYYLKISATTSSGAPKMFDAVLVVKAWEKKKELLNFSPSPATK
ncbi:cysteine proteinase inhibitor B [Nicotiana tabacum]|uniref:Cysteine protease inhibitor n=1 Tax=Nicotiana tabacum TaxID=4097 RepID=A0A075F946_TOBAC|nr:cysteine proteinase inhibitor B-like [Nicotiana tomentosiformis]XP_016503033.1 PREDICTED: cysteine proteinase inhibitor B-like [Nicotiana tabacum]AIE76376.1 cysteine protease inhibitor [Nicotiana tabacum]